MVSTGVNRMLVRDRVDVRLAPITVGPLLPSLTQVIEASKYRPRGSEPPVVRAGQHPWLHPGWKILPTRTAQTPTVAAVVRITTLILRTCTLTTIACGRRSLVTNYGEVARRSS